MGEHSISTRREEFGPLRDSIIDPLNNTGDI
jgi:hypothetical protein